MTEDEMVGWHHRLNGYGFWWTLGVGDGQGGLEFCNSWSRKESDMTEQLNLTELSLSIFSLIFCIYSYVLGRSVTFPNLG